MAYYFAKSLDGEFDALVSRVRHALAAEGFGVITEIDVRNTLKAKIGEDFRPYLILGACNPRMAFEALKLEDKVGAMLPCNVVVQQTAPGRVEVAAIDPAASMAATDNPELLQVAGAVGQKLKAVVSSL
jgi:uncharacterized protein (DUF302 family)